jgi:AcrR family transcriptional regulator
MRSLGEALGVEAMSLYRHVPNKDALLAGVVERVLGEIEVDDRAADWRAGMKAAGRSFWKVLQAHPNAIPLLVASPSITHRAREHSETALRMLARAGLEPADAHRAFRIFQALVLGTALMDRAGPPADELARQLRELDQGGGRFPLLRAVLADPRALDRRRDLERGLELLLGALGTERTL